MKLTPDLKKLFILTFLFAVFAPFFAFAGDFEIKEKGPARTVLVLSQSQFSEERFVFTSDSAGIYQLSSVEFCKESKENPFGVMHTQKGSDKTFFYDGATGRVLVDGDETSRVLVYIPEAKSWFMYDDSVVFVRAVVKARKLVSAWARNRFDKPEFIFFSDGKCRVNDIDCTYTEKNGVFCVIHPYLLSSRLHFLQNGKKLYKGLGYLSEQAEVK